MLTGSADYFPRPQHRDQGPWDVRGVRRLFPRPQPEDRALLRTACNTKDRRVISNDRDFWDPHDTKSLGQRNAPVAKLCREHLGVVVSTLKDTVDELSSP
jgi:hypothetical protein